MSGYAGGTAPRGSAGRIVMWLVATAVILVLLFAYRSSTSGATTAPHAQTPGVVGQPHNQDVRAVVVNGSVARTRWGPVQVQVSISGGHITDVRALTYPSGNGHNTAINTYALPELRQEVLDAQSARIDTVTGATVTSDGYRASLQAALHAADFNA
ncbi:MAG TPA: FMN-binding protein [Micromonosporaceae bacterium]|nr:FMN-binding protein [Micromonosporaceae bacterium]